MRARSLVPVLLGGALAALAAPSCASKKPSAVMIAVDSELEVPKGVDRIEIVAIDGDGVSRFWTKYALPGDTKLPGTIALYAPEGTDAEKPFTVSIYAYLGAHRRFLRRATLRFSDEKTKLLKMPVRISCVDFPEVCSDGQTCLGGQCQAAFVDVEKLPEYEPELVFPAPAGAVPCFDSRACFAGAVDVTGLAAATSDCAFSPAGLDVSKANVALVWGAGDASTSILDADEVEGFSRAGSGLRLAPGLCAAVRGGRVHRVLLGTKCAPKDPNAPVCAVPESSVSDAGVDASDASADADASDAADAAPDVAADGSVVCSVSLPGASCDPIAQTGCPSGTACRVTGSATKGYELVCAASSGTAKAGAACGGDADCAGGLACYQSTCVAYCCSDADCGGSTCTILQTDVANRQFRLCKP